MAGIPSLCHPYCAQLASKVKVCQIDSKRFVEVSDMLVADNSMELASTIADWHTSKDVVGYAKMVHDLKWNREGNYLGMVSSDKTVKVGQLDKAGTFQNVHSIPNSAPMMQVCWNPQDDSRIGMCGDDKSVELWDVRASRASVKLASAGGNISIAWSPCGTFLAVGNKNDVVQVYDLRSSQVFRRKKFSYEVNDLTWTANPNYLLAATGGDGVGSLDILSLGLSSDGDGGGDGGGALAQVPSSSSLATTTSTPAGAAAGVPVGELQLQDTVAAHVSNCIGLRTDAGLRRLAVGGLDHCVSLWDLDDLVCRHTVNIESEVRALSFSGDGAYLAVAGDDPFLTVCDSGSGEAVARLPTKHRLNALAWHPRHTGLLCVAADDRSPSPQFLRFLCFAAAP